MHDHRDLTLSELTALTPLDGRYRSHVAPLTTYLSEYALIRVRVEVECSYLAALSKKGIIRKLTADERKLLENIGPDMEMEDVKKVKRIEEKIRHDVKAVEIFLRELLTKTSMKDCVEMIHFGLTSEDINNLSYRLMLKRATENVMLPALMKLITKLVALAKEERLTPMLARTHGQPAIPTTLGKELAVFAGRLHEEKEALAKHAFSGKLAGAVGNYNALVISFEKVDWAGFAKAFVTNIGLKHTIATAQTNTYEDVVSFFQTVQRINNILIDFDQDMWRYISDNWFMQTVKEEEVGSSTMPQKVNPILFENSEGNLGMANSAIEFFTRKLPITRLQRDLSDSTVIRNFGATLGYCLLGYTNTLAGLARVKPHHKKMEEDLLQDWSILAEAAQTLLRKNNIKDPYSLLKHMTRGETIDEARWKEIVDELPVQKDLKKSLLSLTPKKYIGLAPEIVDKTIKKITGITS